MSGHNSLGTKRSEETRRKLSAQKIGSGNPMYGKPAWNRLPKPERKPCGCGCGELANHGKTYVSGHNTRVNLIPTSAASHDHPYANSCGHVAEHRLIAERQLILDDPTSEHLELYGSRLVLRRSSVVHHINGNPRDNRPENLRVMTRADHTALHHAQGDIHSH